MGKSPIRQMGVTITIGCRREEICYAIIGNKCYFTGMNTYVGMSKSNRADTIKIAESIINNILRIEVRDAETLTFFDLQTHVSNPDQHQLGEFSFQRIDFMVHRRIWQYALDQITHEPTACPRRIIHLFTEQIGENPRQINLLSPVS